MKCRTNAVVEKYLRSITMSFADLTSTLGAWGPGKALYTCHVIIHDLIRFEPHASTQMQ